MKTINLLKRWINMLAGKSQFHVQQGIGKCYSLTEIKGYYNDFTNKVVSINFFDKDGIPMNTTIANITTYFPITIFQYGLGLYDNYLLEREKKYLNEFLKIAEWTINNQEENGMWDCMGKLKDTAHKTQSAMCQSEGVSVLLRAYTATKEKKYYEKASKAIEFMIKDINDGGTAWSDGEDIIFQEYVSKYNVSVLNGWIFSIFGLFDYYLVSKNKKIETILTKTVNTLCKNLKKYDRGFWTNYDVVGTIASPAYNDLHIMQLNVLYKMFKKEELKNYADKWKNYQSKNINKFLAMAIKLKQKLIKSKYYDINTCLVK